MLMFCGRDRHDVYEEEEDQYGYHTGGLVVSPRAHNALFYDHTRNGGTSNVSPWYHCLLSSRFTQCVRMSELPFATSFMSCCAALIPACALPCSLSPLMLQDFRGTQAPPLSPMQPFPNVHSSARHHYQHGARPHSPSEAGVRMWGADTSLSRKGSLSLAQQLA